MSFFSELSQASRRNHSLLCVGLDSDPAHLPPGVGMLDFNRAIIEATAYLVCAYKVNFAFYEAAGTEGWETLRRTVAAVPEGIPVIADAKLADIGNTSRAYARAVFEMLDFGAVTVNPYLGHDALVPFLEYDERGVFILCRTSNPGAADFQGLPVELAGSTVPLYQAVARKAAGWNRAGNIGLVVGATAPEELRALRAQHPTLPFLVPGIGAQGGDLPRVVRDGLDAQGGGLIINASRQVIFASEGTDYAVAAKLAATRLRDDINRCRPA